MTTINNTDPNLLATTQSSRRIKDSTSEEEKLDAKKDKAATIRNPEFEAGRPPELHHHHHQGRQGSSSSSSMIAVGDELDVDTKEVDVDEFEEKRSSWLDKLSNAKMLSKGRTSYHQLSKSRVTSDHRCLVNDLLRQRDDHQLRADKERSTSKTDNHRSPPSYALQEHDDQELQNLNSHTVCVQPLPTSSSHQTPLPQRESLPGAYPTFPTGTNRRQQTSSGISVSMFTYYNNNNNNNNSSSNLQQHQSDDDEDHEHDDDEAEATAASYSQASAITNNSGLVEARPVVDERETMMDLESAEPVYDNNARLQQQSAEAETDSQERTRHKSSTTTRSLLLCFLFVIGSGLIIYFLVASPQRDNLTNPVPPSKNTSNTNTTKGGLFLNISITLPNSTLDTLKNDETLETPQAKAYIWMQRDPHINDYSHDRLIQRFAAVTLFYATNGESWTNTGQEELSIIIYGLGPGGQGGPGGRPSRAGGGGGGNNNNANRMLQQQLPGTNNQTVGGSNTSNCAILGLGSRGSTGQPAGAGAINFTWAKPWLSYETHECNWFSTPLRHEPEANILCDHNDRFVNLNLYNNNLTGSLPPQIGLLTDLLELQLQRNKLGGSLPSEVGLLTDMRLLALRDNQLEGTMPTELGLLSNSLRKFTPLNNNFIGTLPREFWQMSSMEDLRIMKNSFSGIIPNDICNRFPKLKHLNIAENEFTGTIPSTIGLCTDLGLLNIRINDFSGTLPTQLEKLTKLTSLDVSKNRMITGTIPQELQQLTDLDMFYLEQTGLTGTLPESFCELSDLTLSFDCSETLCGCQCSCS